MVACIFPRQITQANVMCMHFCSAVQSWVRPQGHSGRALVRYDRRCRSSFVRHSNQASYDVGQHRCSAQLSFSRSQVHVCLQALSVPAFERVPEDLRFLLPPSIRPSLLVIYRYSDISFSPSSAHTDLRSRRTYPRHLTNASNTTSPAQNAGRVQ